MYKLIIFIYLTLISLVSFSQNKIFYDIIFQDSIKSVYLRPENADLSYPIINLNTNESLILYFDDLNRENLANDYYFTFIHCNSDWTKSEIDFFEFYDGFENQNITTYDNSFSTICDYINYEVKIPNKNERFLISGNYVIIIFKNNDINDTVLTKRFVVTENLIEINGNVKIPSNGLYRDYYQELTFSLKGDFINNLTPNEYLTIVAQQNNRPDRIIYDIKPTYQKNKELVYEDPNNLIFLAGNEFRVFSSNNVRFESERVKKISTENEYFNFYLSPDQENKMYFFQKEINGLFIPQNQLGNQANIDADYVWVHFFLQKSSFASNNKIYLYGEFSNWEKKSKFEMKYYAQDEVYYKKVFLKQGYYNYQYVYENEKPYITIEGNYNITENLYFIYVYFRDLKYNVDRLIGVKIIKR
jgi:mRNA-degrading endonuclease HigB of HigAB toxin-antitoxin module